jgi:hypothetical protein
VVQGFADRVPVSPHLFTATQRVFAACQFLRPVAHRQPSKTTRHPLLAIHFLPPNSFIYRFLAPSEAEGYAESHANSFIYRFYADSLANPFIYRIYEKRPGCGVPETLSVPQCLCSDRFLTPLF